MASSYWPFSSALTPFDINWSKLSCALLTLIPKMASANKNLALTDNFMILQVFKNQSNLLNLGI